MTPRELAEKIGNIATDCFHPSYSGPETFEMRIEPLLSEALAEQWNQVWKEAKEDAFVNWEKDVKEARSAAYEECAKIADDFNKPNTYADADCHDIAEKIRLRAGDLK